MCTYDVVGCEVKVRLGVAFGFWSLSFYWDV
jgi:uncharacterized membrane protein